MPKLKGALFEVEVGDKSHTILQTSIVEDGATDNWGSQPTFNLAMIDVSGSMSSFWTSIMNHWNDHISPELKGNTKIFVFGSDVYFRRNGTQLGTDDFYNQGTNLTAAIASINSEIRDCTEKLVKVFLVTDGHHNSTRIKPDVEIAKLSIPPGKTVEVFLLGLGQSFPVEYSINIRSALHNGNSNVPSLFWVKLDDWSTENIASEILDEVLSIVDILRSRNVKVNFSLPGCLAPGFPETNTAHTNEFVYFPVSPSEISSLKLSIQDEPVDNFELCREHIKLEDLLNGVFRQWNSLIIQHHRKKGEVLPASFEVMEAIYKNFHKRLESDLEATEKSSLKYRISKKRVKFLETEFATLMNQSKTIIGLENKYSSEIELAENILKTTVRSKYFHKNLKMKGHSSEDYEADIKQFSDIFENIKDDIMALPEPSPDDCCRVTMGSMVKDLQDPCLPDLLKEDKFMFMKTFTVTGFPIYAPIKDSSQINPWALCIRNILTSPFTIVSQSTLELSAEFGNISTNSANKDVFLQEGDESSRFNAIIPVFTPEVAKVLRPLIRTNLFSMLATFCILKDPHIIDHNAHLAALGCAWMKIVMDHPSRNNRPQFVVEKLSLIQATAETYLDRGGIAKYLKILLQEPNQALMTESTTEYGEKTLKCESLIKPMFLLYLTKERSTTEKLLTVLPLIILEFYGRCLASYSKAGSSTKCLYSNLFVPALYTKAGRKEWFSKKVEETCIKVLETFKSSHNGNLLQNFFTVEDLQKSLKMFCRQCFKQMEDSMFEFAVNQKVVKSLKNEVGAGNIQLSSLEIFADEISLSEETRNDLFKEEKTFVYVLHSLKNKSSRERLSEPLPTYDEAFKEVKRLVAAENSSRFRAMALKQILREAEEMWHQEFMSAHETQHVKPMLREEIRETASKLGVTITENNFDQVFRHNPKSGLLRNACMITKCPFYLKPNRRFNQHISVFRKADGFVHQLHKISLEQAMKNGKADDVVKSILGGYQSVNGLKIPPTPSAERLQAHKSIISELIDEYKLMKRLQ